MLVLLPDRLDGAPFLAFGMGLLAATCAGALVWLTGWLIAGRQPVQVSWWTGSALAGLGAFLALLLGGPDTAGWMAWRDQLRGYEAVPLRIRVASRPA